MTSETSSLIFETGRFNFLWWLSPQNLILLTRESLQSGQIFRSRHFIPSLNNPLIQTHGQTNISFYSCQISVKRNYLKLIGDRIFSYKTSISRNEQHHPYLTKRLTSWLKLKIRQRPVRSPMSWFQCKSRRFLCALLFKHEHESQKKGDLVIYLQL